MLRTSFALTGLAALLLLAGPLGSRAGVWPFIAGFLMLAGSLLLGLIGASLALVAGIRTGQWGMAGAGIAAGLAVVAVPSAIVLSARGTPPIHDIATDVADPPAFVAVVPLRAGSPNPPEYPGQEVAEQQRRAYPDIQPLVVQQAPAQAFERVVAAIRELGWEIVDTDREAGRVEATDTTFWFGFKDDVVVRVRAADGGAGTRIDVRSKSRVGLGDVGTNARRIRALLERLRATS